MGGLGNGKRRGGRSPPLMIGALIACILVLGFNYWVSSSHNLELQTKLYELESQVRRAAAERGAAELKKNEFQEEIQRQSEQMNRMESFYNKQKEGSRDMCLQEKDTLQQNISSSTKTIQELKGQLNQLNDDLGKLQKALQSCQGNIKTLNNKLTYDMTNCQSQVRSQKELCDKRVAIAKSEVKEKVKKVIPSPGDSKHGKAVAEVGKTDGLVINVPGTVTTSPVVSPIASLSQAKGNKLPELLTNEITVDKGNASSKVDAQSVPSTSAVKQATLLPSEGAAETSKLKNNLTEDKEVDLMDTDDEGTHNGETDPGIESMLMGGAETDESPAGQKTAGPDEYDLEEPAVGGANVEKQQQGKRPENMDLEQELADYNGDDENEGEFEADKQAELARI